MAKPQVIILNGPSSVGKSSIARAIQNIAVEPFLNVRGDAFIEMMPRNVWDAASGFAVVREGNEPHSPILDIKMGRMVERVLSGMRAATAALAQEGNNLIIDAIMTAHEEQADYRRRLIGFPVLFIGLHAPLAALSQREKQRGDRIPGLAEWQAGRVHSGMQYDLELDTSARSAPDCARVIAEAARLVIR